jgi:hypothetical protein
MKFFTLRNQLGGFSRDGIFLHSRIILFSHQITRIRLLVLQKHHRCSDDDKSLRYMDVGPEWAAFTLGLRYKRKAHFSPLCKKKSYSKLKGS